MSRRQVQTVHNLRPDPLPQRKRRVLVVDDNLDTVQSMAVACSD
jgi:hypoxanthine phosphoribosyltransferase